MCQFLKMLDKEMVPYILRVIRQILIKHILHIPIKLLINATWCILFWTYSPFQYTQPVFGGPTEKLLMTSSYPQEQTSSLGG